MWPLGLLVFFSNMCLGFFFLFFFFLGFFFLSTLLCLSYCCNTFSDRPEAPYNLSVISYTWESVFLGWTPGFDGGESQVFTVHFTSSVPTYSGEITVSPADATRYNITGNCLFSSVSLLIRLTQESYNIRINICILHKSL
jgi:hypothetical protein